MFNNTISSLDLRESQTYSECMDILHEASIIGVIISTLNYLDVRK